MRYSLRFALVVVTSIGLVFGYYTRRAAIQRRVIARFDAERVQYSFDYECMLWNGFVAERDSPVMNVPKYASFLPDEYFREIASIRSENAAREITDAVADCRELWSLDLESDKISDEDLRFLSRLRHLHSLRLTCPVDGTFLQHIHSSAPLTMIRLESSRLDETALLQMGRLRDLRSLYISTDALSAGSVSAISGLEQLTLLVVYAKEARGLTELSNLRQASDITLRVAEIPPEAFRTLATLPELQRLTVSCAGVTGENLIAISRSPRLQYLSIEGNQPLGYEELIQLSDLSSLRTVIATFRTNQDRKRLARNVPEVNWVMVKR